MYLLSMDITGFRGFRNTGTLSFSIPNGSFGSGLTVITGPNNAGKSSILECLRARSGFAGASFTAGTRNYHTDAVNIRYVFASGIEILRSVKPGSSETIRGGAISDQKIYCLPSRRAFAPYFLKTYMDRETYLNNTNYSAQRMNALSQFEGRLFHVAKRPERFNKLLFEVIGGSATWTIDQTDQGQFFIKFMNGRVSHSSDGIGEGIVSIFSIIDAIYDSLPGGIIAIDEPELSLHPALQKKLFHLLQRYASDRQIVISTHSPYFINLSSISNGSNIVRVSSGVNGTEINQLSDTAKDIICKISKGNLYNPHLFGLDGRELFFQEDKIILTEGQEDVLLYPEVARQVGVEIEGSFFGWGVGGAENISYICHILNDLGFKKVVAILDGDQSQKLKKLVGDYPQYRFFCIPADDIRTKPPRSAIPERKGLLDRHLKIDENLEPAIIELFEKITKYMSSSAT